MNNIIGDDKTLLIEIIVVKASTQKDIGRGAPVRKGRPTSTKCQCFHSIDPFCSWA